MGAAKVLALTSMHPVRNQILHIFIRYPTSPDSNGPLFQPLQMEQKSLTRRERRFFKPKRPTMLTIPKNVSPNTRLVFEEMRRQRVTYNELEERSGVLRATIKAWRHKNKPGLESIEAVLGALGWDFVPVPRAKVLPKDLVAELGPIVERFGMTVAGATEALIGLVAGIHDRFAEAELAPATAPAMEELASD